MFAFCALTCNRDLARTVPVNYWLLAVFTVCESYSLSLLCAQYTAESVLIVAVVTSFSFVGLSLYALTTKLDVTVCAALIWTLLWVSIGMLFLQFFIPFEAARFAWGLLGCIFAVLFVVFDTQMIFDKCRAEGYGNEDYIYAALMLYYDFVYLFVQLLRIFGERK